MLHDIFRASNKVWYAMYYDELVDTDTHQLSYLAHADRPYFNTAHAVNIGDEHLIDVIEAYFEQRQCSSAFYLDPHTPHNVEHLLLDRGYVESAAELEHWYCFDCNKALDAKRLLDTIEIFQLQHQSLECILFSPMTQSSLLEHFLALDAQANNMSNAGLATLKKNLMVAKDLNVQFVCALVLDHNKPASAGLISLYQDKAFLAEGSTHPDFRRRGIYTWLRQISMLFAARQGVKKIIVNCDCEAYSNNTYRKLGFEYLCQRRFFIKN